MTVDPTVQPDAGPPTSEMFADLRRVHTARGSHIEPPIDPVWSDHTRLLWCAAVVRVDHGIDIRIGPERDGLFPISWDLPNGGSAGTAQPYRQSWEAITRMGEGADAARAADHARTSADHMPDTVIDAAINAAFADEDDPDEGFTSAVYELCAFYDIPLTNNAPRMQDGRCSARSAASSSTSG